MGTPSLRIRRATPARIGRLASIVVVAVTLSHPSTAASTAPCWRPPVSGDISDPFRAPDCPYCAGNRGLEYRLDGSVPVRAAAGGEVTFAGPVAGVDYVVVRLGSGWRLTYGRMSSIDVETGDRVDQGSRLGSASTSFFFGLRVGDEYRDPAPFLGHLAHPARLVPLDGTSARPAAPAVLQCGGSGRAGAVRILGRAGAVAV